MDGGIGLYHIHRENQPPRWLRFDSTDPEFCKLNGLLQSIHTVGAAAPGGAGGARSVGAYLRAAGVSADMLALADASYANTLCSSLDGLDLAEAAVIERHWQTGAGRPDRGGATGGRMSAESAASAASAAEGEPDSHVEGGFGRLLASLADGLAIRCDSRVTAVTAEPGRFRLRCADAAGGFC